MKTRRSAQVEVAPSEKVPDAASLAAVRAWYEGLSAREAVARYLGHTKADGQSSRGMLGAIRRQLIVLARRRHREDLAALFVSPVAERSQHARAVPRAIELLLTLAAPEPLIGDDIGKWLEPRAVRALQA
ncbi:MAG: integrase, partial [Erythrobacter sp.]